VSGALPADPSAPGAVPSFVPLAEQVEHLLAGGRPLRIVQAGHPVLRSAAVPCTGQLGAALLGRLIEAMRQTMQEAPGVGLAAPQVGVGLALAVVEDAAGVQDDAAAARERSAVPFRVLVNPRYEPVGTRRVAFYEGCLSVRGWQAVTARWRSVRLRCEDENGRPVDEVLHGWAARIVQHETDHLAGRLYLDTAEMRSLLSPAEAMRYAADATPQRAARELVFDLP
jgi:peptide deformylase